MLQERPPVSRFAFTLIELLVVITIIVVLLALLTPALDKAIESAQLLQCAANMKAGVTAGQQYAFDHKRSYPARGRGGWMPNFVKDTSSANDPVAHYDLIKDLRPYVGLGTFLDPFAGGIDLSPEFNDPITQLIANQSWFYGWGGQSAWNMSSTFKRVGDRMTYVDLNDGKTRRSSALLGDFDIYDIPNRQTFAGHPDDDGLLTEHIEQNAPNPYFFRLPVQKVTLHWWENVGSPVRRGTFDTNYGFADGSVERFQDVQAIDDRMGRVFDSPAQPTRAQQLPLGR
jgi:prepilin-type N-terminal cleavage/methylation domain-containing protein/prepilin-type processing-associated H-X9-DG protein